MPITRFARLAIGSVKFPRPQKKSATFMSGVSSRSLTARDTMVSFKAWFTCVKSVGLKVMRTLNSESSSPSFVSFSGSAACAVSGPLG